MVTASDATLNSLKPQPQPSTSTTPTVSHPTSVSATTLRPTRNQPGTRLPTSPAALQSLLAPFSSLPSSSPPHGSFASSTHSNEPPPAPSTSTAQPATGGPGSRMGQDDSQKSDAPGFVSALFADVPGTSRVGVDVSTRVDPKITVRNAWQFLPFLTKQGQYNYSTSLTSLSLSYLASLHLQTLTLLFLIYFFYNSWQHCQLVRVPPPLWATEEILGDRDVHLHGFCP